jgi:hypothetical protein
LITINPIVITGQRRAVMLSCPIGMSICELPGRERLTTEKACVSLGLFWADSQMTSGVN